MLKFLERQKFSADPAELARKSLSVADLWSVWWRGVPLALGWFRAFRRTRPFWGGLWLIVGGWMIVRLSMVPLQIVVTAGIAGFGGWLTGGGLIVCGLMVWLAPSQRYVAGILGLLLAIASLVLSNLGGFFVGMVFGIVGGSMALSWGPKRARNRAEVPDQDTSESPSAVAVPAGGRAG